MQGFCFEKINILNNVGFSTAFLLGLCLTISSFVALFSLSCCIDEFRREDKFVYILSCRILVLFLTVFSLCVCEGDIISALIYPAIILLLSSINYAVLYIQRRYFYKEKSVRSYDLPMIKLEEKKFNPDVVEYIKPAEKLRNDDDINVMCVSKIKDMINKLQSKNLTVKDKKHVTETEKIIDKYVSDLSKDAKIGELSDEIFDIITLTEKYDV